MINQKVLTIHKNIQRAASKPRRTNIFPTRCNCSTHVNILFLVWRQEGAKPDSAAKQDLASKPRKGTGDLTLNAPLENTVALFPTSRKTLCFCKTLELENRVYREREMGERDDYKFLGIKDAMASINQKVSLIGVAVEYGFPKKTKGTDCFCTLKIVDQSYPKPGLSVHVFAEHFGALPHVALLGDIVQLSHVMMKTHGKEVYAVFNKRSSAFAMYDGKDGQSFLPYQTYSKFRPRDLDKKLIMSLRKWVVDFQIDEDPNDSHNFSLLRELKESKSVNLACKVINVQEFGKDEWIAFLWDGTDTRPNSIPIRLEDEKDNPLPLHLESLPLSRDKLETFPAIGTVLRVGFDQSIKKYGLQLLNVNIGEWMKFVNVHIEVHGGIWHGLLTPLTKVRYTPNKDHIVYERQSIYEKRLQLRNGRIPYWSFPWMSRVTEIDYKDVPFVTLMDILSYPEVTAKFRCAVRVVAAYPWEGKDFCCSRGIYRLRLTLEDPTARIHAYLYGEDGEKFFGGYPHVAILTRKLNELLGVTACDDGKETKDAARDPPWVQCCLKSYYLDKCDFWGTRYYRIFGTKVVLS